jgi:hypothetical protein
MREIRRREVRGREDERLGVVERDEVSMSGVSLVRMVVLLSK